MNFATLFDRNYISRAEVMIESLMSHMGEGFTKIFVLSLDEDVITYFRGNSKVECIPLSTLEEFFPELKAAKNNRSFVEYIFTLSPFFPLFLLKKFPEMNRITSLDSDLYFFSSPKETLESLGEEKIGITAHSFPTELLHLEKYGKYNVSFQSFPNTETGIKCLQEWAEDCIQFCGDFLDEQGRFADQKYLDSWEKRYRLVEVFPSPKIGLAPWNIHAYQLEFESDSLKISGEKVVFYHFQGLRIKSNHRFTLGLTTYMEQMEPSVSALKVYHFYITKLILKSQGVKDQIQRLQTTTSTGFQSLVDDLRIQPVYFKFGQFGKYLDLRKVIDFAENKLKITLWKQ